MHQSHHTASDRMSLVVLRMQEKMDWRDITEDEGQAYMPIYYFCSKDDL